MTATNHALTGAFIGFAVGNPIVALPAALASHFVCDTLPHFGLERSNTDWLRSRPFKVLLLIDAALCFGLVVLIFTVHPQHWLLAITAAFIAAAPDFYWIGKFRRAIGHEKLKKPSGFGYFASIIQWFQKPIGAVVEVAWLVAFSVLLLPFLR